MCNCIVKRLVLSLALFILWNQSVYGQSRTCSSAEAEKADREASKLRTWDALYRSYHHFAGCDDGSIAEGYSESVGRLLADHWDTLPQAHILFANDRRFHKFIFRHVDATLDTKDLDRIRKNAIHHCPVGDEDFCKELKQAAATALKANGITLDTSDR